MKKSFIITLLAIASLCIIQTSAQAESVLEPQWAEFCPPLYENAVFKPAKENSKRNMENNYWALRKVKFEKSVAEDSVKCYNPAFDVTDAELITAIITERGIARYPYTESLAKLFPR